jgi:catechol 2,3-dioxygenase-like lactoylglutathione lyase family enzyme
MTELRIATPQFLVPDVEATAAYYRDVLGFEIDDTVGNPPVFAMVARDRVSLYFSQSRGEPGRSNREGNPVAYDAYLHTAGVETLAEELRERGATILEGPVERSYGHREIVVEDLNGFVLCFGEPPEWRSSSAP